MTDQTAAPPAVPEAAAARLGAPSREVSAATALHRLFDLLLEWQERARSRHHLQQLDARQLADMGLTCDMLHAETRKPFWRA